MYPLSFFLVNACGRTKIFLVATLFLGAAFSFYSFNSVRISTFTDDDVY